LVYRKSITTFLESLDNKSDQNLAAINPQDIQDYQALRVQTGLTAKTVDRDLKILRSAFGLARKFGLIQFDPTQAIALISRRSKRKEQANTREPFTPKELDILLKAASPEWRTAIMIGRYTGARLGDCVRMTWENVDFDANTLRYSDAKTDKDYAIPLHARLEKHLMALAGDDPKGKLCPSLNGKMTGGTTGLSIQFRQIMAKAGVDDKRVFSKAVKAKTGNKRYFSKRSFHSIRHTYNTELANVGTSQEVRRKLIGHASDDMNDVYTHLDMKLFRQAVNKLP
jgi:integrase